MRRYFGVVAFLGVVVLFSSAPLVEAQKKVGKEKEGSTSEKMAKAGQLVGKVAAVYETKKGIRITVTYPVQKYNQGAITGYAQAQQQYTAAMYKRPPDYNAMRTAQLQMLQHQANIIQTEYKTKDLELTAIDEVEVRTKMPKPDFDEKGNPKKLTRKELAKLKGPDPKKKGYEAEFGDIQTEQFIHVQLVKKKDVPKVRPKKGKLDKEDLDLLAENLPQISSVMILHDPAWAPPPKKGKR